MLQLIVARVGLHSMALPGTLVRLRAIHLRIFVSLIAAQGRRRLFVFGRAQTTRGRPAGLGRRRRGALSRLRAGAHTATG